MNIHGNHAALLAFLLFAPAAFGADLPPTEHEFALPGSAMAWKLGPTGSAILPGFQAVAPGDPRLIGPHQIGINRPNADGLIGSGLRGVDRLQVPLPNGRWSISLWTEDPGEGEFLPHALRRTILVNGHVALSYRMTPSEWVRTVYMAGRDGEAIADGDPWQLFGRRRGGFATLDVDVTDGRLSIEQKGLGAEATFLSAVLAEPADDGHRVLTALDADRRERFLNRWPILSSPAPAGPVPAGLSIRLLAENAPVQPGWRPPAASAAMVPQRAVARGGIALLNFMALSDREEKQPAIRVTEPVLDGTALSTALRWGQWRFRRPSPLANALMVQADHLRGDIQAVTLHAGLPRPLNLIVRVPKDTASGHYAGSIEIEAGGMKRVQPFEIIVLPVVLPEIRQSIGIDLADPPFYEWFDVPTADRDRATRCDLRFLSDLGLTALTAPPATPTMDHIRQFLVQQGQFRDGGFSEPPIWRIADGPGSLPMDLRNIRRILQSAMPDAKIARHLRRKDDRSLLPLLDIALIDSGSGIGADEFAAIRAQGVAPWLYDMPNVELAAGFYLWRTGAGGFLQRPGRLPNADPFDPTDGWEDDAMLLPITAQSCAAVPDVDIHLLQMARGIDDLRWMTWLQAKAANDPAAADLVGKIERAIPRTWKTEDDGVDLVALRSQLVQFARSLR